MPSQFLTQYNTINIMTILSVFFEVISSKHTRACSSLKRWPRSLQTARGFQIAWNIYRINHFGLSAGREISVSPVCAVPLFPQARLLLLITVHDTKFCSTLTLLCSAVHSAIQLHAMDQSHFHDPGRCATARDIMRTTMGRYRTDFPS